MLENRKKQDLECHFVKGDKMKKKVLTSLGLVVLISSLFIGGYQDPMTKRSTYLKALRGVLVLFITFKASLHLK